MYNNMKQRESKDEHSKNQALNLNSFNNYGDKKEDIWINYKDHNYEINTLYQAFSKLAKTVRIASDSLQHGNNVEALLNYHDVLLIFKQIKNDAKSGSCMNNIGCIYIKTKEYDLARKFIENSIQFQQKIVKENQNDANLLKRYKFMLGCRYFNKVLACRAQLMSIINKEMP